METPAAGHYPTAGTMARAAVVSPATRHEPTPAVTGPQGGGGRENPLSRRFAQFWYRPAMLGLTVAILAMAAVVWWMAWAQAAGLGRVGADLSLYLGATRSCLAGGPFYHARQLAGPYPLEDGDILYPPTAIPLFAAFLTLPPVLFWALPLGTVAAVVARHRPAPWAWPLMALCLLYVPTGVKVVHGNPVMWVGAALALGTVWGWPSVLVLLKPSLAPLALLGVRRRSWWAAAGAMGLMSLLFAPMWGDWLRAVLDSRGGGLLYSAQDVPLMLVPVIALAGRSREA